MAFKWFWNEKTEYYDEEINRNTDWGGDASTGGIPVSGGRVQEWLKNEINGKFGVIRISSSINENNFYSLEMFPTKEDEELYDSDNEAFADLITIVPIPISTVQGDAFTAMLRTNMSNTANIVVTDDKLEVELNYRAIKITQIGNENAGYNGSLVVQTSTNGETWNTMGTIPNCLPSSEPDDTSTITKVDIGKYLTNGRQSVRVRAQYTYENEEGVEKTVNSSNVIIGNSVTKTQLSLELRTDFQTPMSTYDQNGAMKQFSVQYNVYGAVRKTLYLEITGSAGTYTTSQSLSMDDDGTTATININENSSYGLLTHGVKKVKAWMEAEDGLGNKVTSNTLVNRFMMVDNKLTGDARLKPYIMLQNVDGEIVNYEQTEIAQYAVYSPKLNEDGSITNDGEAINVAFLITNYAAAGKEPTIEYLRIEQMAEPNKALSLVATVEIEPETEGSTVQSYMGYFRVRRTSSEGVTDFMQESTGETNYRIDIDNTTAFTPIAGAVFFLNPKTRNNSESNPERILNARNNNAEVKSTFTNFGFINDGWMTAEDGQKVLRIPAGATLEINWDVWAQFRKTPLSSMTFTIDYKVSNVTDLASPIISIGDGSKGLTMNALDGWLRTASYNDKDDCLFSWQEDKRTHLAVNVHHAVKPNNGDVYYPSEAQNVNGTLPLARVLIDGVIQREIPFSTTNAGEWSTSESKIVIGNPDADIDIYGIYVYAEKQLEVNEIQSRNVLAAKPTAEEKNAVKTRNNILTGGKIDVEKVKQLGKNCLIWHGVQPYFYNESEQKGWYEIYRYDDEGNYLPEYSGTICKATKSLEVKGQGSTAKTYYDWNQQDDISKVKYDFATENNTILVPMNNIHESIVVGVPYEGSIDEDEGKGGKYQGMMVDVYGGNLGKNYPIENKPMQYPYINGKIMLPDGWIDGNGKYRGRGYKVAENAALAQKNVNKINYASSMQSHLIGACNSYNDLHRKVVGDTPLQKICPTAVSAKHTEPFMVFNQVDDASPVVFRGMGNYGAGKMDKVAWGYVKKLHPMFALIEGSDNNLPMTGFRVPFDKTTAVYSPEGEGWKYADQVSWDFDGGATIGGYNDGWTTDGTNNKGEVEVPSVAIRDRWADVHNFIYLLSTNLKFFDGTYEEFIKSNVAQTDTNYKYWCTQGDKAYDIFRYDFVGKAWVYAGLNGGGINIKTTAPYHSVYRVWDKEGTGDYEILNQRLIDTNVAFMRKYLKYFFNEKSLLFNYSYVIHFIAGTDNSDKNTYFKIMPYAEDFSADANTADGIEFNTWFKARFGKDFDFSNVYQVYMDGDDMDSIFRTNNNSHQTKPYYIDRVNNWDDNDATKKALYEGLGNQLFNFVEKAYSTGHEIADMVKQIFVAMTELVDEKDKFYGEVGIKKSVWGFLHKYFFNVQHYFPEVAYNEQARIRYEFPKLLGFISSGAGARNVDPITQSLGNQLENELQYMNQRLIMMASFAGFGAFGSNHEIGIAEAKETFGFTPATMPDGSPSTYTFTVKTHQYLYPAYTVGGTYYNTRNRCKPNTAFTFTMQGSFASSDTGLGICGINYYTDLGRMEKISIVGDFTIVGKRLTNFNAAGQWISSSNAFRATSITVNTTSLKKFVAGGIPELTNVNLQACVRCSEISVLSTAIKNVITPKSYNLKSLSCGSYINTKTYSLEINDAPNLEKINCVKTSAMTSLYVHPNVGKKSGLSFQSLATDIYTNQKSQSTPTLQEISIQNVNWTDFPSETLEWYCDVPTCEFKGTISIKEDDQLGNPRITWDLKNKIIEKFGNIDSVLGLKHKGLLLSYKRRKFNAENAKIIGNFYVEAGNEFQFEVRPSSLYENTQSLINWGLDSYDYGCAIDGNGKLIVSVLPTWQHSATITAQIWYYDEDAKNTFGDKIFKTIELWNRPAQLGDLVYADGTFSSAANWDGEKTPIGICFYVPPRDKDGNILTKFNNPNDKQLRLMVALEETMVSINGALTSSLQWGCMPIFDANSDAQYALYDTDSTGKKVNLTSSAVNKVPNVYDIQAVRNLTTRGLDNPYIDPDPTTNENKTASDYRDLNSSDGVLNDGFKCITPDMAVGDGFAYNESQISFDSIGERTLTSELAKLAGSGYKENDLVNSGYAKTLKIIAHRNNLLNNDIIGADGEVIYQGGSLPLPSVSGSVSEMKALGTLIDQLRTWASQASGLNDPYPTKWQQMAYPFVSACYAYQPTQALQDGEVLADKFKAHNWFAPTEGHLTRICWYAKYGTKGNFDAFKGARDKGLLGTLTTSSSLHWSVTESYSNNSWNVGFNLGVTSYLGKYYNSVGRAVAAF